MPKSIFAVQLSARRWNDHRLHTLSFKAHFRSSYYEQMLRHFPNPDLLISNGQAGRGNQLQARFVFELKQEPLSTLPEPQRGFWSDFARWILGERLRTLHPRQVFRADQKSVS